MPPKPPALWTPGRRWAGNLLPLLLGLPFAGLAGWEVVQNGPTFAALGLAVAWTATTWLATNFLGLLGNRHMKRATELRLKAQGVDLADERWFVGFARPSYRGALDPHEDIGWLNLRSDEVEFIGTTERFQLDRAMVTAIRLRPNPHSWVGLGGWVSIEGKAGDTEIRMLIEPRDHSTLWANRKLRRRLYARLKEWAPSVPAPDPEPDPA